MKFRNTTDKELSFKLGTSMFIVGAAGVVDIPDKFAYAIESMGLPMKVEPDPEPVAAPVRATFSPGRKPTRE